PPLPSDGSLPAGLEAICARALHVDPDRRYQTALDLEIELEGVLVGAADSHARNLGKVVSMAFAKERAERQTVIERCVRAHAQRRAAPTAPGGTAALPTIESPVKDSGEVTPARKTPPALDAEVQPAPAARREVWWWRTAAVCGLLAALMMILVVVERRRSP